MTPISHGYRSRKTAAFPVRVPCAAWRGSARILPPIQRGEFRLAGLREELVSKTYRADPARRPTIPKPGGGVRPLGIPTIRDRVVQTAVKIVLEPIFEADFEDNAFGYRPRRSVVDAVKETHRLIRRGYTDVVDADRTNAKATPLQSVLRCRDLLLV